MLAAPLSPARWGYCEKKAICKVAGSGSRIALPAGPLHPGEQTLSAPSVNLATAALSAGPEIHQAYRHALTLMPQYLSYTGYDQQGLVDLRAIIARRYSERGLPTQADEVMIVNGALSGFARYCVC